MHINKDIKLAKYTTFHIGGRAEFFAEVKSIEEVRKAVDFAKRNKLKIFVFGGGSNVLLPDKGIRGLVLKINIGGITFQSNKEHKSSKYVLVSAGAGEEWDKVVKMAVARNLGGIENLSLIPGTVGGAVYQNIGAYGAELKDILESVDVLDMKSRLAMSKIPNIASRHIKRLSDRDCQFGYRTSIFQKPAGKNYIILGVFLRLLKNPIPNLIYPDLAEYFNSQKPSVQEIRKAVIKIRKSKLVYPTKSIGTVGSFFRNPVITTSNYRFLISKHPDLRGKEIGGELMKLSAGQLIEKCGWKGKRIGKAGVSEKHALVLVSYKGCKSADILKIARLIRKSVKNKFGVLLEPEVKIVV